MVAFDRYASLQVNEAVQPERVRPIVKLGDSMLRQECQPVTDFISAGPVIDDLHVTLDFIKSLYDFGRGCGLAAPQIGEALRIAVVEYDGDRRVVINPEVQHRSAEMFTIREGCLSFFDARGDVRRHREITVSALDEFGQTQIISAANEFSSLMQHELDHLDGILYFDRLPGRESALYYPESYPYIP